MLGLNLKAAKRFTGGIVAEARKRLGSGANPTSGWCCEKGLPFSLPFDYFFETSLVAGRS